MRNCCTCLSQGVVGGLRATNEDTPGNTAHDMLRRCAIMILPALESCVSAHVSGR